ncbi:aminoglycoside phosphotransferase [Kineococcus sp. NUM-3379]
MAAARAVCAPLGLAVEDAIVLHASNKLTLRLLPCDVVARVVPRSPEAHRVAVFELEVARRLAERGSPVARPEPRVAPVAHEHDGLVVTLWTAYDPAPNHAIDPAGYAAALRRLHAGMRGLDVPAPDVAERTGQAARLLADRERTPALGDADREVLSSTVRNLGRVVAGSGGRQFLHGEPHPGNLLATGEELLFVDFETCCHGPVEFDLAHAPDDVAAHYPGADPVLLRRCRMLVLAMICTWRWDREDRFPDGRRLGEEWLGELRAMRERHGPDG